MINLMYHFNTKMIVNSFVLPFPWLIHPLTLFQLAKVRRGGEADSGSPFKLFYIILKLAKPVSQNFVFPSFMFSWNILH